MRIQPLEIEVPEDDPFKNDLLGREDTVKVLTSIVRSIEGPCVLSVDAAWGAGKTTFLKIWAQYLRNQKFPVVEFNAWETDFSEEPFIALSTELTEGLKDYAYADESVTEKIDDIKSKTKEVARSLIPGIIKAAAAGVPLVGGVVGESLAALAEERLNAYEKVRKSVKDFKRTLEEMAESLSKSKGGRPLVLVIDELDRCRPSYAVELLEVAKHLFAVDHVVFVLGVNRSELAHSVKALYGDEFDALGYLGRFFDLDFRLPEPDRAAFINAMLDAIRIDDCFKQRKDPQKQQGDTVARKLLLAFLNTPDINLRRVAQAIHRLGLVFASLPRDLQLFPKMTVVMFILRTVNTDLYFRFVDGEASDVEVVDTLFNRPRIKPLQGTKEGLLLETMIILANHEREQFSKLSPEHSPLLKRYYDLEISYENAKKIDGSVHSEDEKHAIEVIRSVKRFYDQYIDCREFGFKQSVERIELLSAVLIDGRAFDSGFSDAFG